MTTPFTPEQLSSSLPLWYDGQDPNGNDRASLPDSSGTDEWENKGYQGNRAFAYNNILSQNNATIPKYLASGSIVKLAITNAGAGYSIGGADNGVITDFEVYDTASRSDRSKVLLNLSILGGQVITVASIGGSLGYEVGDTLVETSDQNSGGTNAVFTVTEVTYRGGMLFNSEAGRSDHYRSTTVANLKDITIFIACNLRADTSTDPFFTLSFLPNFDAERIEIAVDNSNAQSYTETVSYKRKDNGQAFNFSSVGSFEGFDRIYMIQLSETVLGKFQLNAGTLTSDLPTCDIGGIIAPSIMVDETFAANKSRKGTVYEYLIFDRILDSTERAKMFGYLEHKYSLDVLPADHIYKGQPPTLTNAPPITEQLPEQPSDPTTPPGQPTTPENPNPADPEPEPNAAPLPPEQDSSLFFNGAHRLSPRKPVQLVEMFLDFCDNEYGNSTAPNTCTANAGAGNECYNTKTTCQDTGNYRLNTNGKFAYRFGSEEGGSFNSARQFKNAYPALISVTSAPVEIVPTKGVSLRANVTIKLRDFYSTGADVDPYFETRDLIALENGSYLQKLVQRNAFYVGRKIRVYDGYIDNTGVAKVADGRKDYVIDSFQLDKDVLTIKCKDPMTLADELKAKVPVPSEFSLKTAVVSGTNDNEVLTIGGADATAEQLQAEYGTSGFVRINEEIIAYTRAEGDANMDFHSSGRGEWGTSEDTHDAGDTVQKCVAFGQYDGSGSGVTINDVAYELLVTQAGVPAEAINNSPLGGAYSWVNEKTAWLSTYRIDAIFSEPKEVNKQLSQLGGMVGVNFFYDELAAKIIMKAETPELDNNAIKTITDDVIVEDSVKFINSEKERISRVYYYYNMRNHIDDRDKPKSFKNLYIAADAEGETASEYGVAGIKTIYGYGVNDTSTATSVSQRLLARFKNTPKTVTFKVDASNANIKTGDHFYLDTKQIVNFNGEPQTIEMQCLSVKLDRKTQSYDIKAKQFRFSKANKGIVAANDVAAFSTGGGNGTEDSPYTGVRATESYFADKNHITVAILNGGQDFGNGETIEFTPDESEYTGMAANTRNLAVTYTQSGGEITSIDSVTSNAASGAVPSAVQDGYGQDEILTGTGSSGTGLRVKITKRARMSGAQEPYLIV